MNILISASILLASWIQPSATPEFPGCTAVEGLMNQYKAQDGALVGESSFTLNALFYDSVYYFDSPVLLDGARKAYAVTSAIGTDIYWIEQVMGLGMHKADALEMFNNLASDFRKCYPDVSEDSQLYPESQDDLDIYASLSFVDNEGYYYDLWMYADLDAMYDDLLENPDSQSTFFQVVLILGQE